MKSMLIALSVLSVLSALAPLSAAAAPPEPTRSTVVSCAHPNWPTAGELRTALYGPTVIVGMRSEPARDAAPAGAQAVASAEDAQRHIRRAGRDECWSGATHVRIDVYRAPAARRDAAG